MKIEVGGEVGIVCGSVSIAGVLGMMEAKAFKKCMQLCHCEVILY